MTQPSLPMPRRVGPADGIAAARAHFASLEGGRLTTLEDFVSMVALATQPGDGRKVDSVVAAAHVRMESYDLKLTFTEERARAVLIHAAQVLLDAGPGDPAIAARIEQLMADVARRRAAELAESEALYAKIQPLLPEGYELLEHQKEALRLVQKRGYRCVVHDEQGLGKTVEILCAILLRSLEIDVFPILIACPASIVGVWEEHVPQWAHTLCPNVVSLKDWDGTAAERMVLVGSYARMTRRTEELRRLGLKTVVFDESHYLVGPKTQRSISALLVRGKAHTVLLGTGTMQPNGRPIECFASFKLIDPTSRDLRYKRYAFRWCGAYYASMRGRKFLEDKGVSNPVEFARVVDRYSFRRTKAELGDQLPPKIRYRIPVRLTMKERIEIAKVKDAVRSKLMERAQEKMKEAADLSTNNRKRRFLEATAEAISGSTAIAEMQRLRAVSGKIKVRAAVDRCVELVADGHRVVVFFYFRDNQQEAFEALQQKLGSKVLNGTGDLDGPARTALVSRANDAAKVIVLSYAYCEGITLTSFDTVLIAERHWIPDKERQAEDRCIAEGQEVLTPQGWRPIEDIAIGDLVVHRSGVGRVTDAWSRGSTKNMVEISIRGWPKPIVSTFDHKYLTSDGRWVEADTVRPGDRLAVPSLCGEGIDFVNFDEDCRLPGSFVGSGGLQSNGRLLRAPDRVPLDEKTLFVIGYFAGDGFSSIKEGKGRFISLSGNDNKKEAALQVCREWADRHGISHSTYTGSDGGHGRELRLFSGEWALWFSKLFGRTVHEKHLPEWIASLSRLQAQHLLNGLIASDGYSRKGRNEYATCSYRLAADVAMVMLLAGKRPCITFARQAGSHVVAFTDGQLPEAGMVVSEVRIRSPRKNSSGRREKVYDLTVEGDPSFVVGLSVVHNCHRIGQKNTVYIEYISAMGTMDDTMDKVHGIKEHRAGQAVGSGHTRLFQWLGLEEK